jgi:class 3 adenylate cyclase
VTNISRILTLVFTDLADSTALKTQRGDQAVGELITRHRAQVRRLAAESGGRVIDWAGDGCFLTFETPSAAVLFALRLQQVHREEPDLPGVRTGIHMGEVSERPGPDGDLAHPRVEGLAVDLAARISGLARAGQVLMSSSVADSARCASRRSSSMCRTTTISGRGNAYVQNGEWERGLAELRRAKDLDPHNPDVMSGLGHAYAVAGDRDAAQKVLEELRQQSQENYVSPYYSALIYTALGDTDRAFALIEGAYDDRGFYIISLKVEPMVDPLRSDPRFAALLKKVGLEL